MKRAKVSQALFAKVAASKSQVLIFARWCESDEGDTYKSFLLHERSNLANLRPQLKQGWLVCVCVCVCVEESPDNQPAAVLCRGLSSVHQTAIVS